MPRYTVIGVYTEPAYQRFAQGFDAETPQDAERQAGEMAGYGFVVAAVLPGDVLPVDEDDGILARCERCGDPITEEDGRGDDGLCATCAAEAEG